MVIQSNMPSKAIVEIWPETKSLFENNKIRICNFPLSSLVTTELLPTLLQQLNTIVGSSAVTCIEGG